VSFILWKTVTCHSFCGKLLRAIHFVEGCCVPFISYYFLKKIWVLIVIETKETTDNSLLLLLCPKESKYTEKPESQNQ
jgi:hypothetical protein